MELGRWFTRVLSISPPIFHGAPAKGKPRKENTSSVASDCQALLRSRCRYCKHELSVCQAKRLGVSPQIPITNQYCFEMFIPSDCSVIEESYIALNQAIPGEMKMWTPDFVTREGLQCEATIEFGDAGSKITGGGWKQLMNDYTVRPGHNMYMYLHNGGHRISVDFKADGVQLSPLFFVAMRGLSCTEGKIIDRCIYARGIRLQYHEMKILIESSFGPTKYPCCVFVNRLSNRDVTGGYMKVPKRVVARTEKKSGLLDREGEDSRLTQVCLV
ncbi:hypothetical protein ZWY2020_051682 [Hordeum vulgare]|nr:hypothetical protein ZWY2020_051682 [Hordeum vulgare]